MKIICIGRNYAEHAREMHHALPEAPVLFMKPETAVKRKNMPFFLPGFSKEMHYETEIVYRVCRNGKNIEAKFAHKYIDQVTVGIDFTARDLQSYQKQKGLPWEIAKAFDDSACLGDWKPISAFSDLKNIGFHMEKNGVLAQQGNTRDMIYPVDQIIEYASRFFLLLEGDVIFTGTPAGVGAVAVGDHLVCYLESEQLLEFDVK